MQFSFKSCPPPCHTSGSQVAQRRCRWAPICVKDRHRCPASRPSQAQRPFPPEPQRGAAPGRGVRFRFRSVELSFAQSSSTQLSPPNATRLSYRLLKRLLSSATQFLASFLHQLKVLLHEFLYLCSLLTINLVVRRRLHAFFLIAGHHLCHAKRA